VKERLERFQRSRLGLFVKKLMDDQAPNLASLLAWGTLSALLPLLLGMLSLAGLVLRDPRTLDQVYSTIVAVLPSDIAGLVGGVIDGIRNAPAGSVGIIALLLLLFNGSAFFSNMAAVFDQAYHVEGRNPLVERLIALAMLVVTAALLVISTLAAGLATLVDSLPGALPIGPVLGKVVSWSIEILSVFALFMLMYRVLPNAKQTWKDVLPGAVLSTVLLLVVSQVFPLYLTLFPPNQAYALFGVFLVFTFFLYLVGFVLVLGAEFNAFLEEPARSVALAEATTSAQRGRAQFVQDSGQVRAEAQGRAPNLSGGGAMDAQVQSTAPQAGTDEECPPQPKPSLAGRILGFVGLVLAMLLLRKQTASPTNERTAA
jgi:membrane protein